MVVTPCASRCPPSKGGHFKSLPLLKGESRRSRQGVANSDDMTDRVIAGSMIEEEAPYELSLRPRVLAEYIGQQNVKDNLDVAIQAARKRGEPLDHILLYGPPGLGKTTLASVIANEMNARFRSTAGPLIALKGDLTAILTNLEFGDV